MEWRVKLVLHYDGRKFFGWQKQNDQRTVQGELESLLERLCGAETKTTAAGRTDTGVHATGQVASALIPARFDPAELHRALNALAPPDLWIASVQRVHSDFHPRYDASSRTYIYRVGACEKARSPFNARWCWPLGRRPDLERMRGPTAAIVGRHDFGAFAKAGQPERGVNCTVSDAAWSEARGAGGAELLTFRITADRFLHHMVRYVVGTLVDIGIGKREENELELLLRAAEGFSASPPAPAEGLFLTGVQYSSKYAKS